MEDSVAARDWRRCRSKRSQHSPTSLAQSPVFLPNPPFLPFFLWCDILLTRLYHPSLVSTIPLPPSKFYSPIHERQMPHLTTICGFVPDAKHHPPLPLRRNPPSPILIPLLMGGAVFLPRSLLLTGEGNIQTLLLSISIARLSPPSTPTSSSFSYFLYSSSCSYSSSTSSSSPSHTSPTSPPPPSQLLKYSYHQQYPSQHL